jgi:hypothetical protein
MVKALNFETWISTLAFKGAAGIWSTLCQLSAGDAADWAFAGGANRIESEAAAAREVTTASRRNGEIIGVGTKQRFCEESHYFAMAAQPMLSKTDPLNNRRLHWSGR